MSKLGKKLIAAATKKKLKHKPVKKLAKPGKESAVDTYILLDRSASMSNKWAETLASINTYAKELAKQSVKGNLALAMFDLHGGLQFDVIRNEPAAKFWTDVTQTESFPRGSTPLYDAIGKIVALAEAHAPITAKTIIAVMTDGEENASCELSKDSAKALLDRVRAKGWQVVFLGADFDSFGQAASVGVNRNTTILMSAGNYAPTMRAFAANRQSYGSGASATMDWSDAQRATASADNKQKQKAA